MTGELVLLDSRKIRKRFLASCRQARTTFEKAEREFEQFETEVLPTFERWRRSELGPDIQEVESLGQQLEERAMKLEILQRILMEYGCTPREALEIYEQQMNAREKTETEEDREERERLKERIAEEQERQQRKMEMAWEEMEELLVEFLKRNRRPIRKALRAKVEAEELLKEVLATFAYEEGLDGGMLAAFVRRERVRRLLEEEGLAETRRTETPDPGADKRARVKQLAREMAFALHPDRCGGRDEKKLELWHRVRAAVDAGDLDELEVLHAHMQLMLGDVSPNVSVSRLRDLTEMYRRSRGALRRQILRFRKMPAYAFYYGGESKRERIRREMRSELESRREMLLRELREVQSGLEMFTDPPRAGRRSRRW